MSLFVIAGLGFLVYSNSLKGEFIWDDNWLVKDNAAIQHWSGIPKIFLRGIESGIEYSYRPLQAITYLIDHSLWGLKPFGYHLSNIFFHVLAAISLYGLIYVLFQDWLLAFLTSAFFVVHPVHTEAVSYIAGRSDSLALLFMLVVIILYVKTLESKNRWCYVLALVSYLGALLSREHSVVLPVVLLLYHYAFKKKFWAKGFIPVLLVTLTYIFLRVTLLKPLLYVAQNLSTLWQRIPGFFVALSTYLRLLVLPVHLHMEYGSNVFSISEPRSAGGFLLLLSALFYILKEKRRRSLGFFSVSWFFLTLLPVSNLYPINAYMAEHWLYLPSVGFFLIVARGFSSWL